MGGGMRGGARGWGRAKAMTRQCVRSEVSKSARFSATRKHISLDVAHVKKKK